MDTHRSTSRLDGVTTVRAEVRREVGHLTVAGAAGVGEVVVSLLEPW
ncbi:MAG: hypothetical protein QOJ68_2044, partial [Blastococcus sp.]|nr:hypothetical protein [Blastococcus sp.]